MKNTNIKLQKLIALKKANSLLTRIIKMVEDDQYCIDIMQQNLAVIGLLKSFHQLTLKNHLHSCFKNGLESKSDTKKAQAIDEVLSVFSLSNR